LRLTPHVIDSQQDRPSLIRQPTQFRAGHVRIGQCGPLSRQYMGEIIDPHRKIGAMHFLADCNP
jgi:hypothetical protein